VFVDARLLTHDPHTRALEHAAGFRVGGEIERVLTGSGRSGAQLGRVDRRDRASNGVGRIFEDFEQGVG
jgi:hypothetical protein